MPSYTLNDLVKLYPDIAAKELVESTILSHCVNDPDMFGIMPLHWAIFHHHYLLCKQLILAGAKLDYIDPRDGGNFLHVAAECDMPSKYARGELDQIRDLLITHGVSVEAKNKEGNTPIDVASASNNHAFFKATKLFSTSRHYSAESKDDESGAAAGDFTKVKLTGEALHAAEKDAP